MAQSIWLLIGNIIQIYIYIIFAMIVMSWLLSFGVMNIRSPWVGRVWKLLEQATEPVMGPVRRLIPPLGGLDLSPIVVIFALLFIQDLAYRMALGGAV